MSARLEFFTAQLAKFQASGEPLRIIKSLRAPWHSTPKQRIIVLDSSFNPPTLAHMYMARTAVEAEEGVRGCGGGTTPTSTTTATTTATATATTTTAHIDGTPAPTTATGLLLLLAVNNADKAPTPAPFAQRLCMMEIFAHDLLQQLTGSSGPSSIAIGLTTRAFFHEKASALAALDEACSPAPEQVYLAGFDTLVRIFNARYYGSAEAMRSVLDAFFARARLRVTVREDAGVDAKAQMAYLEQLRGGALRDGGGRSEWADRVVVVPGIEGPAVSSTAVRKAVRAGGGGLERLVSERVAEWVKTEGLYRE